jgi:hypothetical protein
MWQACDAPRLVGVAYCREHLDESVLSS